MCVCDVCVYVRVSSHVCVCVFVVYVSFFVICVSVCM